MFIGRQSELAELEKRWQSGTFEFGVVYGTRRIGKTTLLQEFVKDKNAFYFQARKADEKDNLTAFSREFRKSRSLDEHLQYDSFDSAFDSIADMQYRGAVYIRKRERQGNLLRVEGTAYLTDTYVRTFVREKDEKIHFVLEKEADGRDDPGFSIHRVSCPTCGGSFDAMHRIHCPYCGNPYDLKKKDWIIKDMWKAYI